MIRMIVTIVLAAFEWAMAQSRENGLMGVFWGAMVLVTLPSSIVFFLGIDESRSMLAQGYHGHMMAFWDSVEGKVDLVIYYFIQLGVLFIIKSLI